MLHAHRRERRPKHGGGRQRVALLDGAIVEVRKAVRLNLKDANARNILTVLLTGRGLLSGESESFGARRSGSDRERRGYGRTPNDLPRTAEFGAGPQVVGDSGKSAGKRQRPGTVVSGRWRQLACPASFAGDSFSSPTRTQTWNKPVNRRVCFPAKKPQKPFSPSDLHSSSFVCKRVRAVVCGSEQARNFRRKRGGPRGRAEDARKNCGRLWDRPRSGRQAPRSLVARVAHELFRQRRRHSLGQVRAQERASCGGRGARVAKAIVWCEEYALLQGNRGADSTNVCCGLTLSAVRACGEPRNPQPSAIIRGCPAHWHPIDSLRPFARANDDRSGMCPAGPPLEARSLVSRPENQPASG
jgi:hypothetical protein